ncbi:hypothetical protein [Amycolatopsis orientalis]|uniref:hypothetical protein n=1 Tax=Amycolatopsis orientalis TaxID=31958 RepID=UPI00039AA36F|nr:hypothetical protein [Amycolatopsis orientalis]
MAIAETLAAKTISENILQRLAFTAVGICSTLWMAFAALLHITEPTAIAERVGDYLGFPNVQEKLSPVAAWAAEPRHGALFIGAAVIAGILFNLGATPILTVKNSAPRIAWVFFLFAVQGTELLTSATIVAVTSLLAFVSSWFAAGESRDIVISLIVLAKNIFVNLIVMFYPISVLASWFLASYGGEMPADLSRERPQPTGAATTPPAPVR